MFNFNKQSKANSYNHYNLNSPYFINQQRYKKLSKISIFNIFFPIYNKQRLIGQKNLKKEFVMNYVSKKSMSFFNGGFPTMIPNAIKYCIGASTLIYILGFTKSYPEYIKTFMFNDNSIRSGNIISLLTCHFTKAGFFDLLIDSFIMVLISSSIVSYTGVAGLNTLIASSIGISSIILLLTSTGNYHIKSDAIFRGLIWYIIFQNPQSSFFLFPLPIQIKAIYIGYFLVFIDLLTKKPSNFGGSIAAYLLSKGRI